MITAIVIIIILPLFENSVPNTNISSSDPVSHLIVLQMKPREDKELVQGHRLINGRVGIQNQACLTQEPMPRPPAGEIFLCVDDLFSIPS